MPLFYLDNDVDHDLAPLLEHLDPVPRVYTTRGVGCNDAKDDEQLLIAAQRDWVLITYNWRDYYVLLHDAWVRWTQARCAGELTPLRVRRWSIRLLSRAISPASPQHAGILILPQGNPEDNALRVKALLDRAAPLRGMLWRWRQHTDWQLRRPRPFHEPLL